MITRFSPTEPIRSFDRFNKFMEDLWKSPNGSAFKWYPAFDIVENEKTTKFVADLPGMEEKDVTVELQDGHLSIHGERSTEKEEKGDNWLLCERSSGSFFRQFTVDPTIKPDQVKAEFAKGVLTVSIPKVAEKKAQKIAIKSK
jgi:HSP20 family protein